MSCCWTGATCAVLPFKNALPRSSPETVNTAVALQLKSKTCTLAAATVGVVVFGARFFTGAGVAFTGALFLLLFVLIAAGARGGAGIVARQ